MYTRTGKILSLPFCKQTWFKDAVYSLFTCSLIVKFEQEKAKLWYNILFEGYKYGIFLTIDRNNSSMSLHNFYPQALLLVSMSKTRSRVKVFFFQRTEMNLI